MMGLGESEHSAFMRRHCGRYLDSSLGNLKNVNPFCGHDSSQTRHLDV